MIHESLILLWKNPTPAEVPHLLELGTFLHPGEAQLLQKIVDIALSCGWIESFCRNINGTTQEFYIKAFALGVREVLADYHNEIIALEGSFLLNPQLPLTFILSTVEKYQMLFETLRGIIEGLERENLRGCMIMGRLHRYIYCGNKVIEGAVTKLVVSLNRVFYQHLCNWIIYGNIVDLHEEFFINDGGCPDENFLYPEQLEEMSSTASSLNSSLFSKRRIRRPPVVQKFSINPHMIPAFISENTAESILFMGRIVWIVRNAPQKADDPHQRGYERNIWEGRDVEYYKKIQALETQVFDEIEFQRIIEECRIRLTKYLWSVMLDEGNLKEHLHLIRDYYALGRGELFHQFVSATETHTPPPLNDHSLNFFFLETAQKMYGENDKTYLRFEITTTSEGGGSIPSDPWRNLQLKFEVSWPLHIVFHPKCMELYNKLFSYLLRLSSTQIRLNTLWRAHMTTKEIDRRVWTLRQRLMFLVNNLQYYLQVDVIEANFSLMLKAVDNANEFEDIVKVHHEFITNLLAKSFILTPDKEHVYENKHRLHQTPAVKFNAPSQVYNMVVRLLALCDDFCLKAAIWEVQLTDPDLDELDMLEKKTEESVNMLLHILFQLHKKTKGQHILQLLHQFDFNRFFTKSKMDFAVDSP